MKIERPDLIAELDAFARSGHGLVTGEPGVGKTYSMAELHDRWDAAGYPHLMIPVDRLGSLTDAEIRAALGISTNLMEHVALYFAAKGKGVVVFDGFDAARSETTRERVLALVREALERSGDQWNVLVSVRIYDANRSHSLRSLFRDASGMPPSKGIGLDETRHLHIPNLSEREVLSAVAQINGLGDVYQRATAEFRSLLHIPFNIWLVEQILGRSGTAAPLSTVASEVQLLTLYWQRRVEAGDKGMEARHLLSRMVGMMVTEQSLSVRADAVYAVNEAAIWDEIFSAGVVERTGSTGQRLAFSHNTLFDYAVSVLLMDDDPAAMHGFIAEDFGRPLFLRPSISFYYTRLWYEKRDAFWASVWETLRSKQIHVRLVGRLVPPAVIVNEARLPEDLDPALDAIKKGSAEATEVVLRVLQAVAALLPENDDLWTSICANIAAHPRRELAWNVVTIAHGIAEKHKANLTESLRDRLGLVGRSTLVWALEQRKGKPDGFADSVGSLWAVPLVAVTFISSPEESDRLLRQVLALLDEPGFPVQYFTRLSDAVGDLAPVAPGLVADVYRAVFGHAETSEEETSFGSPILPLRSTRRQDFGMCEYVLDKEFDKFLDHAPRIATEAALDAFSSYVVANHVTPYLREGYKISDREYPLTFRGRTGDVIADLSAVWLDSAHPDYAVSLLRKACERLRTIATQGSEEAVDDTLEAFGEHARVQAAWVELLRAGMAAPANLGPKLAELALSRDLQRNAYHEVVTFVSATAAEWTPNQLSAFEMSVESLYHEGGEEDEKDVLTRLADRFVVALPKEVTKSKGLLARRDALEAANAVPPNEPPFRVQVSSRAYSSEDWLSERGVDVQSPPIRALLDQANVLEQEVQKSRNSRASAEEAKTVYEQMRELQRLLATTAGLQRDAVELVTTRVAAAAGLIVKAKGEVPPENLSTARAVLMEAAHLPFQNPEERATRDFDMPAWSPSPQTEAAQALPWLIIQKSDEQVLDAIEHLARSPEPSVRFLVATEAFRLRWNAEEKFWAIVERFAAEESSRGVLSGLMHSLGSIKTKDAPRVAAILEKLRARGIGVDDRSQYAEGYVRLVAWLAFNVVDKWAVGLLDLIAREPVNHIPLAKRMVFEALGIVTPKFLEDARVRPMSERAVKWVRELLAGILSLTPEELTGRANLELAKSVHGIVDDVGRRIYYNIHSDRSDKDNPPTEGIGAYYDITRPLVEDLIAFGKKAEGNLLAPTAHHLMEFLHVCLPLDPKGVLHLAAELVSSTERSGYNLDGMAVREIVAIAEELLADHRGEISEGKSLEDFVRLLDAFANNGWPEAMRVVLRIDEIFR